MQGNEQFVREMYDAMARGDGRKLAQALTAETRWVMPGRGILSGTYTGPKEIFGLWKRIAELSGGGLYLELRDVLANDERAVAFDERQVAVLEFADGELRSATFIYEDPQAYEAFWH